MLRAVLLAIPLLFVPDADTAEAPAPKGEVSKDVKGLVFRIDVSRAHPGGLLIAHVRSKKAIGPASFVLEGQRCPVYYGPQGLRALVPVPLTAPGGPTVLGFEIRGRRGRRRVPIEIEIAPRTFSPRTHEIPESKKELLERPERVRDSRHVLGAIRRQTTDALARGPLRPPVEAAPEPVFGMIETYVGAHFVPLLTDGVYGDHHRGLDYAVAVGTPVRAPGAGVIALAQPLSFAGQAIVIDHGRGVTSALFHLSRISVSVGDKVEAGAILGASGDTGMAVTPHLHWGVYVHGVPVDPRILETVELG